MSVETPPGDLPQPEPRRIRPVWAILTALTALAVVAVAMQLWDEYNMRVVADSDPRPGLLLWALGALLIGIAGALIGLVVLWGREMPGRSAVGQTLALGILPMVVGLAWPLFALAPSVVAWMPLPVLDTLLGPEVTTVSWFLVGLSVSHLAAATPASE